MSGFRVQDYYKFYSKSTTKGRHCEYSECKHVEESHYHCNFCPMSMRGLMTARMEKHTRKKHAKELEPFGTVDASSPYVNTLDTHTVWPQSITPLASCESISTSSATITTDDIPSKTSVTVNSDSGPAPECIFSPPFSPSKSIVVKKSKVSTPMSSKPGNVVFSSPGISPLHHKTATSSHADHNKAVSNDRASISVKGKAPSECIIPHCQSTTRLKSLLRKKLRGGGSNTIDWNSTMLQITYFRLVDIDDPSNFSICAQHWKEWYHYDYNLQKSLGALSQKSQEENRFLGLMNAAQSSITKCVLNIKWLDLFEENPNLLARVLNYLDHLSLQNLSRTCSFFSEVVKHHLGNDLVCQRLLLQNYFIDRNLHGKSPSETLQIINSYCLETANTIQHDSEFDKISLQETLTTELTAAMANESDLRKLIRNFGENRKPSQIEVLVYFTAKCLLPYFANYHLSIKSAQQGDMLASDFRVGAEIMRTPLVLLLFDLILTGNEMCYPPDDKQTLFRLLSINSIRHKMKDYKIVTPLHKTLSNEVSLTCSKDLMTILNRSGLAFSYAKDLKDSKISRQL